MTPPIAIHGNVAGPGSTQINNVNLTTAQTNDDIDRACLRALQCPDPFAVKNRLQEKDKLLYKSISWIFRDSKYTGWQDGDNFNLLWIKGGAGKGKTMMSIGLVEQLSQAKEEESFVIYFFCQNADYELNTIQAIIKGLIFRLISLQKDLIECLRRRWDAVTKRFDEDLTSWRPLWDILLGMIDQSTLLRLIVRTGLPRHSKIKWLLTSRPLDDAEQELLTGSDQELVSLELNSDYIAQAVKTYVATKAAELDRRQRYGPVLRREVEAALLEKAEDTFLWVSLVCARLESVAGNKVLATIQELPPGLHPFYDRILQELSQGGYAKGCLRLLKMMLLAYRPLKLEEVAAVASLPNEQLGELVDRCASFVKRRDTDVDFIHQSARDYLCENDGQLILDSLGLYEHGDVALSCLSYLSGRLKVDLMDLTWPDSTRESVKDLSDNKRIMKLASMDYAATFWVQHLHIAKHTMLIQDALAEHGKVDKFLHEKLLEWLECLSLLEELPRAIEVFNVLREVVEERLYISEYLKDALRFLFRHYQTIVTWPLQTYSTAIVFSPQTSAVRRANLDKVPKWLRKVPRVDETWTSLIQTLAGHSSSVLAVAFSPDGKQIASGSGDKTIKLWDATTGDLQKTIAGHSGWVEAVAFSPDGKQIASGSGDKTIKLWDATTGDL